jgi:membrane protein DedA with SNARE-associated domain/rhodanese-related sulfurtransferase
MRAIATLFEQYGVSLVFLNVLLEQIGLPIPAVPTLIVAGALVVDGRLSGFAVLGAALLACAIADACWYMAGRRYGSGVMKTLCRISLSPDSCVRQTEARFERWGASLLLFAKFVPLVAMIASPLAGAMGVGWPAWLLFSTLGSFVWASAAIGAGLVFHAQIEYVFTVLEEMGRVGLLLLALLIAGYVLAKYLQRRQFLKTLRMARITVDELQALIQTGAKPTIIDVRSPGVRARDGRRIPGALLVDTAEQDIELLELPGDGEIILYCTCPNEASAARIAKSLMRRGFTHVRPLLGGFDAWIEAGLTVDTLPVAGSAQQERKSQPCIDNTP